MRRTTPLALAALAAALLLAGCGEDRSDAGRSVSPEPTRENCAGALRLTAADSGRTLCLAKGGELRLSLDGDKARPWKPVRTEGGALTAINSGFVLQPGDANAAYRAEKTGTVELTSTHGTERWQVTVRVR
ncbi:hypothetical protein [Streptomyces sp. BV129]|uniref:hypothetical protein n=1 Tax=Streptomyces sp. BV129 TaxID=2849671 RepID=UPI001C2EE370|nr:hypothetical protein [Streptomyces sp. BV129]MBV1947928.1 hypothetical protein [Streptomyces sp. BV129]